MINAHLSGWKAIAEFLGTSVRTAQRWETEFGLPVIRAQGDKKGVVAAVPSELEAWFRKSRYLLDRDARERGAADLDAPAEAALAQPGAQGPAGLAHPKGRGWISKRTAVVLALVVVLGAAGWLGLTRLGRPTKKAGASIAGFTLPAGNPDVVTGQHSLRRAILLLTSADGWSMTVRVPDGSTATIAVPGAGTFGLIGAFRDDDLDLSLVRLKTLNASGAVAATMESGPRLRRGATASLASIGCPVSVEWTGEDVAPPSGSPSQDPLNERCCVTCDTRTACSQEVSSSCGSCAVPGLTKPR